MAGRARRPAATWSAGARPARSRCRSAAGAARYHSPSPRRRAGNGHRASSARRRNSRSDGGDRGVRRRDRQRRRPRPAPRSPPAPRSAPSWNAAAKLREAGSSVSDNCNCRACRSSRRSRSGITSTGRMRMARLCSRAQPLGDRAVQVARAQPQFVGQRLRRRVQIGEMVAPALDLAPHLRHRIVGRRRAARAHPVERARERGDPARRARTAIRRVRCGRSPDRRTADRPAAAASPPRPRPAPPPPAAADRSRTARPAARSASRTAAAGCVRSG